MNIGSLEDFRTVKDLWKPLSLLKAFYVCEASSGDQTSGKPFKLRKNLNLKTPVRYFNSRPLKIPVLEDSWRFNYLS